MPPQKCCKIVTRLNRLIQREAELNLVLSHWHQSMIYFSSFLTSTFFMWASFSSWFSHLSLQMASSSPQTSPFSLFCLVGNNLNKYLGTESDWSNLGHVPITKPITMAEEQETSIGCEWDQSHPTPWQGISHHI